MDKFNPNHYISKDYLNEIDSSSIKFSYSDYIKNNSSYSFNKTLYCDTYNINDKSHLIIPLKDINQTLKFNTQNNIVEFVGISKSITNTDIFIDGNTNIFLYQNNLMPFLTIHNININISKNSNCNIFLISDAQQSKIKNNFEILLNSNSCLNFEVLTITQKEQYQDDSIIINHSEESQSNINYKSFNNGICVSQVNSIIFEKSSNANTNQKLKHVMLSSSAKVFSKPNLEIFNPNVKASHGNSIGSINLDDSIYLQMRSISIEKYLEIITTEAKNNFYLNVEKLLAL